jgi:hypothetical protein
MTAYVEECRQEWKRLGVPDLLAEEMATEPAPQRKRRRRWIVAGLIVLSLVAVVVAIVALFAAASASVHKSVSSPRPVRAFALPNLVGLEACHARRIALEAGVNVERTPRGRCDAVVVGESPGRARFPSPHGSGRP